MYEVWVSIALLGLWSCVGTIYRNSRNASRQLDEIVRLMKDIAATVDPSTQRNERRYTAAPIVCEHRHPDPAKYPVA